MDDITTVPTSELIAELIRRDEATRWTPQLVVDGRELRKAESAGERREFDAYVDRLLLEGAITEILAAPKRRGVIFTRDPASGDYSPGSLVCTAHMATLSLRRSDA